jgi:1-acyl-sn-glycerol-3-phosphate acyltransferase
MKQHWAQALRGCCSILFYALNTFVCCIPVFLVAMVKMIIPLKSVQNACRKILTLIANIWIAVNNLNQKLFSRTRLEITGLTDMTLNGWYMVVANHQSWVDILALQRVFYREIPFLKFFLKKELFWFPFLGQAWWALDFPFMKRYNRAFLKKNPHLIGEDLEITKRACEKFRDIPVSIMNFVEGTRFTEEKHARQRSPHTHLLRPRAGGIAFVLGAMGDKLQHIVDVTIAYPHAKYSFWDFVCGRIRQIKVHVRKLPIQNDLMGDYMNDPQFKRDFQKWLNDLWQEKDHRMTQLMSQSNLI